MSEQYRSLFKKCFILWKRGYAGSICEFIMVLVFAGLLVFVDSLRTVTTKPTTSYLQKGAAMPLNPPQALQGLGFPNDYIALNNIALQKSGIGFQVRWYDSREAMENFMQSDAYGGLDSTGFTTQICMGLSVQEYDTTTGKYSYSIHYNATGQPRDKEVQDPRDGNIVTPYEVEDQFWYYKNIGSGSALFQHMIDTLIVRLYSNDSNLQINAQVINNPVASYSTSNIYFLTQGSISMYVLFPLIVLFLRFVYFVLLEKEQRITQNLRNMGMKNLPYYFSWYSFYALVLFVYGIVWTAMVGSTFFRYSNKLLVFFCFYLTGLFFLSLGFFICAFFVNAKPGVLTSLVLFFVLYGGNIGLQAIKSPTEAAYTGFSISPFAALEKACNIMILLESSGYGFGFQNFSSLINNYRYVTFFLFTIGEIIFFFVLGMYLDQVYPTETGVKRHWLFCLRRKKQKSNRNSLVHNSSNNQNDMLQESDYVEKPDKTMKLQIEENKAIILNKLKKTYPNGKTAVQDLSLQMYSDQIFAFLGHNGAGKTTTISMMSGLIDKTEGGINILGYDSVEDRTEIQHVMGICPQVNPIYDALTVAEHLELYAVVKCANNSDSSDKNEKKGYDRNKEIEKIMKDIDLYDKRDYPAGKLSGGQKRKLCVAISFIGNSKVVILDEPTSGMDTYARRHLWEMLKLYKQGRILILTTHYMDEADYLADRIGIMADGKLVTCGTGLFLKEKFGAGYDLTIVKKDVHVPSQPIVDVVLQAVPDVTVVGTISMEVKLQLPTKHAAKFEQLFLKLDQNKDKYGIQTYGVSMTTLEEVFLKVALNKQEKEELEHQTKAVEKPEERPAELDMELEEMRVKNGFEIFKMHYNALCLKRLLYLKRDVKGLVCEIVIPILVVFVGLFITLVNFISQSQDFPVTPSSMLVPQSVRINAPAANSLLQRQNSYVSWVPLTTVPALTDLDNFIFNNYDASNYYSIFVSSLDTSTKNFNYTVFLNTTASYGLNVAINMMNEEILRAMTGSRNSYLNATIRMMPLTVQWKSFENSVDGLICTFLISLAFAFIPSSIIMFIVYERENNVKHQQIVSGVSLMAYWISNFTVDIVKYLICGIFACVAIQAYRVKAFRTSDPFSVTVILTFFYGCSMILFTYCTSFFFKSPSGAQVFTFIFNFFTGFILMLVAFILRLIDSTSYASLWVVEYFFRLFPSFDYSFGLFSMANDTVFQAVYSLDGPPSPWGWFGARKELIAMPILVVLFIIFIYWIENAKGKIEKDDTAPQEKKADDPPVPEEHPEGEWVMGQPLVQEEDEVKTEAQNVKSSEDYSVKVQGMTKIFKIVKGTICSKKKIITNKVAVNNISFGVKKGDCFGLLGTNGAGKTTTFKILTGEIHQSRGIARINGKNLETDMKKIIHQIGYCPQFDALLANLTAKEHLEMYCAIKGIPEKYRKAIIEHLLHKLNLKKYENVQAGTYSGGNKRKLSVAIALLGNPPVVFLDEPSSGMDPEARRFMWSVVSSITSQRKSSSVILTTHSMDEAEALSTKLAIMVEGEIKCIGPVQQLKNKYGQGYEIEVKIKPPEKADLENLFNQAELSNDPEEELKKEALLAFFEGSGLPELADDLEKATGDTALISTQLRNKGAVKKIYAGELVYFQQKSSKLRSFLQQNFGKVSLIESFQSFYRFKIEEQCLLSKLFGLIEKNRQQLSLLQYSVKQTTIEQIFIGFANQRQVQDD